jgi:hypothetical protein
VEPIDNITALMKEGSSSSIRDWVPSKSLSAKGGGLSAWSKSELRSSEQLATVYQKTIIFIVNTRNPQI